MLFVATEQFTCLIFTKAGTQNDSDGLASGNVRGFADCNAEGTGKQGSQTGQQDKAAGQGTRAGQQGRAAGKGSRAGKQDRAVGYGSRTGQQHRAAGETVS